MLPSESTISSSTLSSSLSSVPSSGSALIKQEVDNDNNNNQVDPLPENSTIVFKLKQELDEEEIKKVVSVFPFKKVPNVFTKNRKQITPEVLELKYEVQEENYIDESDPLPMLIESITTTNIPTTRNVGAKSFHMNAINTSRKCYQNKKSLKANSTNNNNNNNNNNYNNMQSVFFKSEEQSPFLSFSCSKCSVIFLNESRCLNHMINCTTKVHQEQITVITSKAIEKCGNNSSTTTKTVSTKLQCTNTNHFKTTLEDTEDGLEEFQKKKRKIK